MKHLTSEIEYIPVTELFPHPDNPRKDLGDLTELADSIRQNGIMQNLTVVQGHWMSREEYADMAKAEGVNKSDARLAWSPKDSWSEAGYMVIIGHRRLAAAKQAGLETVPCVVTDMDEKTQLRTMLLENMQRSDLKPFEEAQGFQMMLDMGDTVEEIAERTGFSQTTVRRRVKMTELDNKLLQEVSDRPFTLMDFDKLAQIEDLKARNEVLKSIGTSDFNRQVETQLRQQAVARNLPAVKKILKSAKAKKLSQSETWGGKYDGVGKYSYSIAEWHAGEDLIPKEATGQVYYYLDESYGTIRFFKERKKAPPVKRSPEEIAKDKRIADAWAVIHEQAEVSYKLRSDFVKNLNYTQKNASLILKGALLAGVLKSTDYMSSDRDTIMDMLDQDKNSYDRDRGIKVLEAFAKVDPKSYPAFIYALWGDGPKEDYTGSSYQKEYPQYYSSSKLTGLYAWLTDLGYEMSSEEKDMQDGIHEVYHRNETEAEKLEHLAELVG